MQYNKSRPPLKFNEFSGVFVCGRPSFFDFNKKFLYNIYSR